MKILIVSDTHGKDENIEKVIEAEKPFDALIHCGDIEGREDYIEALAECPAYMVAGNNDFFSDLNREIIVDIGGNRVFVTHGHAYGVSMSTAHLVEEAKYKNADIVIYGHTHKPVVKEKHGVQVINPGSLAFPRQEGRKPSYVVMNIDDGGKVDCVIEYMEKP